MSDEDRTRILAEFQYKRERLPHRKETVTLLTPPIIAGLVAGGLILSGQPWAAAAVAISIMAGWGVGWGANARGQSDLREILRTLRPLLPLPSHEPKLTGTQEDDPPDSSPNK